MSRAYGHLVRLYPRQFRDDFAQELVDLFEDLESERGVRAAWRITSIDLLVTVPRYRLEQLMNQQTTTNVIFATVIALAVAGVVSLLTGVYPGLLFLGVALVIALSQRSALAKAIRVSDSGLRRRRLRIAGVLGAVFVADYVLYLAVIGERWTGRETVLALVGTVCMVVSACYLVAGLLTPRSSSYETSLRA